MALSDWTKEDGQPLQEQDIAELAGAMLDNDWPLERIAKSLEITTERLEAIMQAAEEWHNLLYESIAGGTERKAH